MRTGGVIGGLGPETTSHFYLDVVQRCERDFNERPPLAVWNIPLPLHIERDLILKSQGQERYKPYLETAAKLLERSGSEVLAMPCNSLHIFINDVRKSVNVPVLSIIEESVSKLRSDQVRSVAVLGTETTVESRMYQTPLEEAGIEVVLPGKEDQHHINEVIDRILAKKTTEHDKSAMTHIMGQMDSDNILLACTDFQNIVSGVQDKKIYDTMAILAAGLVREMNAVGDAAYAGPDRVS